MENENENLDSPNEEEEETSEEVETDDPVALKEELTKTQEKNRQLFERAKKAEGFVKGEDGKWVKRQEPKPEPKPEPKEPEALSPGGLSKEEADKLFEEKMNERDLKTLDLSDELKQEIRDYAKAKGVSFLDASKSAYISFLKSEEEKKAKEGKASISPGRKPTPATKVFSKDTRPNDFDKSTPEGRADYKEWKRQNP